MTNANNGRDTEQGIIHNQALLQALITQRDMAWNRCAQLEAKLAVLIAEREAPPTPKPIEADLVPKDEALG